jgi:DNA polymerase-3 subunit delta
MLAEEADSQKSGLPVKKTKKKKQLATDLLVAKNPKNSYPIFQLFKKSERFSKEELLEAVDSLNQTDKRLKSSGQNPKLVLENIIFSICKK